MRKKFTMLLASMFLCMGAWAADFTLSNGSSSSLNWSSDGSSSCSPWANTAVTENLPDGLSGKTVTKTESTVTISEAGAITVTFQYSNGNQRLDMQGVDLVDANGNVVVSDYHHGFTGGKKDGNVYTLVTPNTGDYTLRYWVNQGNYLYETNGTITVSYENTAVYERRIAVEKTTSVISDIRNTVGVVPVEEISSNGAFGYMEGSLANLMDGKTNTYFQSNWSSWGGTADAPHYVQITLGEEISLNEFYLEWTTRDNGSDVPEKANIIASTTGEDDTWDVLQEDIASTKGAAATTFKSNTFSITNASGVVYKYVRFVCTSAQTIISAENGEYAFGLSELAVKTELSTEDQELLYLCDAAQAVIDDEKSTAADINEQFRTLKLATVEKPTYPFTLTTDDANPTLYVIKSGREGNPCFTLANDGYISLTAFTGADTQAWYFKEEVNEDYEYVLNIIPYAAPTTTMGYTSTDDNPAMVSNAASNTCNDWLLDKEYSKLGIKPYKRQATYLSNNGGVGNKMGFWYQDPDTDPGTALYITLATDEVNTLLSNLVTSAETITAGTKVGSYTAESVERTLTPAIKTANSVKNSETATYAEKVNAIAELNAVINSLEIILPEEGKFYKLVSNNSGYSNGRKAYVKLTDNKAYWDNAETAMEDTDTRAIWQFELLGENKVAIKNVHTNSYLPVAGHNATFATLGETAGQFVVNHLADGVIGLRGVNGEDIHAPQYNGQALLGWNNSSSIGASAWVVEEVSAPVHTLSVTAAEWSTIVLGYNATIPITEGFKAYTIASQEDGYVKLEEATGVLAAGVPVLVNASEGDYVFSYTTDAATVTTSGLAGTLYNKNITAEAYVLSKPEKKEVGLYKAALTDGAFLNNANKAYYVPASGSSAPMFSFDRGEGTTGIEDAELTIDNVVIYDLLGRRVEKMEKGIYIVNGKKVVIK